MEQEFSAQLNQYLQQTGLPMSRVARQADIPRQTLFNWLNGTSPRWHTQLADDLKRLGAALGLDEHQIAHMLALAGCGPVTHQPPAQHGSRPALPEGWFAAGSQPAAYHMGLDPFTTYGAKPSISIKSIGASAPGFATIMQHFDAQQYRGARLQLSGVLKAVNVIGWAGLWMRVDASNQRSLAFDNMQDRPITGSSDWTRYAVVLDVADEAALVAFGMLLGGGGQIWLANLQLDPVGDNVPTTDRMEARPAMPDRPINLAFDT